MQPTGQCALCHNTALLEDSHFIPASVYKNLSDPNGPIPHPIAVGAGKSLQTSKQVSQHLLCKDCEIRFQQGGENWFLGKRLLPNGRFPLRDEILAAKPVGSKDGRTLYELSSIPSVNVGQIVYFGASIFWRASVADWNTPLGTKQARLHLGNELEEKFRRFLLGTPPYPSEAILTVSLSAALDPLRVVTLPSETPTGADYKQYEFYLPGVMFSLIFGAGANSLAKISIASPPHLISIDPKVDERIQKVGKQKAVESKAVGKLSDHIK